MTILGSKLSMNFQPNQKTSDIVVILTVLSAIFVTMKLILGWRRRPPGPWGLPVLGHLPFLGSRPLNKFKQYQKEYGDVVFLRFGTWPTVIISGKDTVKSTLALDSFASRPPFFSIKSLSHMKGLSFCFFDERYLLHRKIASSVVREFGETENSVLTDALREESNILVSSFLANNGQPFNPSKHIYVTTGSIIFQFCYGKNENIRENPAFLKVMEDQAFFKEFFTAVNYFDVLPWLRYIMPGKFNRFLRLIDHFQKARKEIGAPIMKTYDPAHPRHAFDGFLNACLKYNITDTPSEEGLTKTQLTETLLEIFGAGFETTASTMRWALMYYAEYQDVQMKVQKEIDDKIGRNKVLSIKDRSVLPYTEATILEIMRAAPVVPMALPHMTTTDVVVKGNVIEKETVVFFNIMSLMHDDYWGNPNEFQPERFLDEDGCLIKEKVDNVLAFGAGRRICLGKMIAQAEIFYLLATLLQNCKICKPKNVQYDFEGEYGLSYFPKEYEICVQPR